MQNNVGGQVQPRLVHKLLTIKAIEKAERGSADSAIPKRFWNR